LARLCLADTVLWDAEAERELHCALGAAADRTLKGDSLCCGRFGRAAILRSAARDQEDQRWIDAANAIEDAGVSGARARGGYSFVDTLGMFTGASGVGLALLDSLSDPEHRVLPAILSAGLYRAPP
jgi:lantibiotic modifying enzyme